MNLASQIPATRFYDLVQILATFTDGPRLPANIAAHDAKDGDANHHRPQAELKAPDRVRVGHPPILPRGLAGCIAIPIFEVNQYPSAC